MKRYNIRLSVHGLSCMYHLDEHPKGEYVCYEDVKDFVEFAMHTYVEDYTMPDSDTCMACGHNIRHLIHKRFPIPEPPEATDDD